MKKSFDDTRIYLRESIENYIDITYMQKCNYSQIKIYPQIPQKIIKEFYSFVDKVCVNLLESAKDSFYGYFLFDMERKISFNLSSASGVNYKNSKFIIYFNPLIFLGLNLKQMQSTIKHEIHHIVLFHLYRRKELKNIYSNIAINIAMDVVVNQYLDNLPPYSVTLNYINNKYHINLKPYNTLEYYVKNIQNKLDMLDYNKKGDVFIQEKSKQSVAIKFNISSSHDLWDNDSQIDQKTLMDFTKKYINKAKRGKISGHIEAMITSLNDVMPTLPWNLYLKKIMGTIASNKRKTITRLSRRQPNRLDLKGYLTNSKANILVALDVSGSIGEEEFKQAINEVLCIVRNYNTKITIAECDKEIKRVYDVCSIKQIKKRSSYGGGTRFTPVFELANSKKIDLLIYFTDGKGEKEIDIPILKYKVLWVITGKENQLSLNKPFGAIKNLKNVIQKEDIDLKDIKTDGYSMNNQEPIF